MQYRYTAYSKDKKIVRGNIESTSVKTAENSLYKAGFERILQLQRSSGKINWEKMVKGEPKVSRQALQDFTSELSMLINAGLTLLMALRQLQKQSTDKTFKKVIGQIANDLQGGTPFHQALSMHPRIFNETYCTVMDANEKAGTLERGLDQLAKEIRQEIAVRSQIQKAVMQPAIIVVMAVAVVILMSIVVLPQLVGIFKEFGANLPLTTRFLIAFSDFINNNLLALAIAVVVIGLAIYVFLKQPRSKAVLDRLMIRMPLFGGVIIWHNTALISRNLSNLLGSGILLPDSISIALRSINNSHYRESMVRARKQLVQGQSLSAVMSQDKLFPPLLVEMIGVGEASGNLESSLETVADYFEVKMEKRINRLTSLLEPALIIAVGLVVGLIAVSMISTIYGLVGSLDA